MSQTITVFSNINNNNISKSISFILLFTGFIMIITGYIRNEKSNKDVNSNNTLNDTLNSDSSSKDISKSNNGGDILSVFPQLFSDRDVWSKLNGFNDFYPWNKMDIPSYALDYKTPMNGFGRSIGHSFL